MNAYYKRNRPHAVESGVLCALLFLVWATLACRPVHGAGINWRHATLDKPLSVILLWGYGPRKIWDGFIDIEHGQLVSVKPYQMEKGDSVWQTSSSAARFHSLTAGSLDGCALQVSGSPATRLIFRSSAGTVGVRLISLLDGRRAIKLGHQGLTVLLYRPPRRVLSFERLRTSYMFAPGAVWNPSLILRPGFHGREKWHARLHVEILAPSGRVVRSNNIPVTVSGGINRLKVSTHLPSREGGYTGRFTISGLPFNVPVLPIDLVVLAHADHAQRAALAHQQAGRGPTQPELEESIQCARDLGPGKFRSDGHTRILKGTAGDSRETGAAAHQLFRVPSRRQGSSWMAFRLAVDHPGRPYLLRVVYPRNIRQRFVISILDRNATPIATNVLDEMVYSAGGGAPAHWGTKDIVFWPKRTHVGVLIVNALNGYHAAVHRISLFELPTLSSLRPAPAVCKSMGAYYEEPVFARQFGGGQPQDWLAANRDGTLPDWSNWYRGAKRLVDLMARFGYTRLMLPVYGYGSAIYPSHYLGDGTRYVSGVKFSDDREPLRPDVVRLLLRLLQRHNMKLVPVFEFYGRVSALNPLPAVDGTDVGDSDALLNTAGRSAARVLGLHNPDIGPYYDPLAPRVQSWVVDVLSEFLGRYGDSSALGPVALQLNTSGWIQYPGPDWGYNRTAVQQFAASRGLTLPDNIAPGAQGRWVRDHGLQTQWLAWRNASLLAFYRRLAKLVTSDTHHSILAFSYMNIFSSRYSERSRYLNAPTEGGLRTYLTNRGIDPMALAEIPNTAIIRPVRLPVAPGSGREPSEVSLSPAAQHLFHNAGAAGAVVFHDYYETWLPGLKHQLWWPTRYWMVASYFNRRQIERAFGDTATRACYDGGYQLPQY